MGVNNVNNGSGVVWNSNFTRTKAEKAEVSNIAKPANTDKLVLNLPINETVYNRQEFVSDQQMGEGCAFCYTYMERTLTFASGKCGALTFKSSGGDGYFVINADKTKQTFGKSGADMNDIEHAVEETWERRDRAWKQSTVSGGLSAGIAGDNQMTGGAIGFTEQSTTFKYSSASETKGMLVFKNGGVGNYRETAFSSREIYNKCAAFLAKAFGENSSDLVLNDREFISLFGKLGGNKKTSSVNAAQKRENPDKQLNRLKTFMEKNLSAVREKNPDCRSLQVFTDTYTKLAAYNYSDVTSIVEKMYASENLIDLSDFPKE